MGVSSRRKSEELIRQGRITVNGQKIKLGASIYPQNDQIAIDGRLIASQKAPHVYWLFHKPDKTICSKRLQDDRKTIYELPSLRSVPFRVLNVGRLDYRTEGLLLLTNDGELQYRLTHPRFEIERTYMACVNRRLSEDQLTQIRSGVNLEDGLVKQIKIRYSHKGCVSGRQGYWYEVSVSEGRNRLVRRIFSHFDACMLRLIRTRMGNLSLPENLEAGRYRQLTRAELHELRKLVGLADKEKS